MFDFNKVLAKFIDTDFRACPQYVMGDLGRDESKCAGVRSYEDENPTIIHPRSQFKPLADSIQAANAGLENLVTRILNQSNEGSCVGNAETQMHQVIQAKQYGKTIVTQLSPISAYKQIGSSPNSGAMVSDAMEAGRDVGILPLDTPANREKFGDKVMPATGFYSKYPADWKETAKQFRFDEYFVIRTLEGLVSALLNGHPVQVGREGHSILYVGIKFKGNAMYAIYANSWSEDWGFAAGDFKGGFGLDTERQMVKSAGWAFACRSVVVPPWQLAA